jgi:CRISPR-associated protein Cas2
MRHRHWYLLAYDISEPRRLQRVHYYLRKRGLAAQESVFFLHASEAELQDILDAVAELMELREDDLRAYPIQHPAEVWLTGQAVVAGPLLQPPVSSQARPPAESRASGLRGLVGRWWRAKS